MDGSFRGKTITAALRVVCQVACVAIAFVGLSSATVVRAQSAICAEVKIEIRQKINLERQAFDAVLRIRNGLTTASVDAVAVNLVFQDADGHTVVASSDTDNLDASFFVRLDTLDGISALDGSASVAPSTVATARWIIIPASSAGGSLPIGLLYFVGASISYSLNGEARSVEVTPESIIVLPQPKLRLDYFLAGAVYADDPFTPAEEPPVPFTLGVRIENDGAGPASKLTIESAQPTIVENTQGLLIGFNIIGGYVDDQPADPSLLLTFGDIEPGAARMGRWLMTTTLSGRFTELSAEYTHADSLGGALTSLIDGQPASHLLVHDVLVDLPGRDTVRDFLALDADVLRVYESNGIDNEVLDRSAVATLTPGGTATSYALQFPPTTGLAYAVVTDPTNGRATTLHAVRSDGSSVRSENAWLSKKRNADLSWSYFFNVFDANTQGSYLLTADAPASNSTIAGFVYDDVDANGSRGSDEPGIGGVQVTLSGGADGLLLTTLTDAVGSWHFDGLTAGVYALAVEPVLGYDSGTSVPGGAGGTAASDAITDITLGDDAAADGYLFGKIPQANAIVADLQVTALDGVASLQTETATSLTVHAGNGGPHDAVAVIAVTLPPSFTVDSAAPSVGTYNEATHLWALGDVQPGDAPSLTIQGRYTSAGTFVLGAQISAVDAAVIDADPANNVRQMSVTVEETTALTLSATLQPSSRVLVSLACDVSVVPDCATDRAQRWSALFDAAAVEHVVTTTAADFARDFRSGDWNVVWIDGGTEALGDTLIAELHESVLRGNSLVVSGARDAASSALEALAGAAMAAGLPAAPRTVTKVSSEYFDVEQLSSLGAATRYDLTDGRALGSFDTGGTAIVGRAALDDGRAVVFGFDVLASLENSATSSAVLSGLSHGLNVAVPDIVFGSQRVPVLLHAAKHNADHAALVLDVTLPAGAALLSSVPPASEGAAPEFTWEGFLDAPSYAYDVDLLFAVPDVVGIVSVDALALTGDAGNAESVARSLALSVRDFDAQAAATYAALNALVVTGDENLAAVSAARLAFDDAMSAHAASDYDDVLVDVLVALASIDRIVGSDTGAVRAAAGLLLYAAERDWHAATDGASVSGSVFVDANANGQQDADEPGLSDISVTLTGADGAVAQTLSTGAGGTWSFANLSAGTYAIAVAATSDYDDGVGTPGSAAGLGGDGVISNIVLATDQRADGYLFAKVPHEAATVVDLAIEVEALTLIEVGATTTLRVRAGNNGPDSTQAAVVVQLPAEFVVTAAATDVGDFDEASGHWSVGTVSPGVERALTIEGHYTAVGVSHIAGAIEATDSTVIDPDSSNDAGSVDVTVVDGPVGASIAGSIYIDANGNDVRDANEESFANLAVTLSGTEGFPPQTVTTDADGSWRFTNLPSGTYALAVDVASGYQDGMAVPGSAGGTAGAGSIIGIALPAQGAASGYVFAKVPISIPTVADLAITELDGPISVQTDAPTALAVHVGNLGPHSAAAVADVQMPAGFVVASFTAGTGVFDPDTGTWAVGDVLPGNDAVLTIEGTFSIPGPATFAAAVRPADAAVSDPDATNNAQSMTIEVDAPPLPASIAGSVYADLDGNGNQEVNEPGLGGVAVTLSGDAGFATQTMFSAFDGTWQFGSLPAGTFAVTVGAVDGYQDGIHQSGSAGGTVSTDAISGIVLTAGTPATGYRFAKIPESELVVADLAVTAIEGSTSILTDVPTTLHIDVGNLGPDAAAARVTVQLPTSFVVSAAAPSVGTFDAISGVWDLGDLVSGASPELVLEGHYATPGDIVIAAAIAPTDGAVSDPNAANDSKLLAVSVTAVPPPATLAGTVYVDANDNGVRDSGEPGLAGVSLTLTSDDGASPLSTVSGPDGGWLFAALPAGTYAVTVGVAANYDDGLALPGSAGGNAAAGVITHIVLAPGTHATGYLFAKVPHSVAHVADLFLAALEGQSTVEPNEPAILTARAGNGGAEVATASVTLVLPPSFVVDSVVPGAGSYDVASGVWSIGTLMPNNEPALTIQGHYLVAGVLTTQASIQSTDGSSDPDPTNNARTLVVYVIGDRIFSNGFEQQ